MSFCQKRNYKKLNKKCNKKFINKIICNTSTAMSAPNLHHKEQT